jgi:hypothetical protein
MLHGRCDFLSQCTDYAHSSSKNENRAKANKSSIQNTSFREFNSNFTLSLLVFFILERFVTVMVHYTAVIIGITKLLILLKNSDYIHSRLTCLWVVLRLVSLR